MKDAQVGDRVMYMNTEWTVRHNVSRDGILRLENEDESAYPHESDVALLSRDTAEEAPEVLVPNWQVKNVTIKDTGAVEIHPASELSKDSESIPLQYVRYLSDQIRVQLDQIDKDEDLTSNNAHRVRTIKSLVETMSHVMATGDH